MTVAVIDNGFDVNHPDLKSHITKQIDAADGSNNAQTNARGEGYNHGTMAA
ncbi:MAG: S8 family serine peptidase [Candidatus Peribacteria bacterium]|nr:MAG: S8 family serine peptidase [Candidatus Peribacteria bacterium]